MRKGIRRLSAKGSPSDGGLWFPVSLQILSWFFLNVLLVGAAAGVFLLAHRGPLLGVLLNGRTTKRLDSLVSEVNDRISALPTSRWGEVTASLARRFGMSFGLVRREGDLQAGWLPVIPEEVAGKVRELSAAAPPPPPPLSRPTQGFDGAEPPRREPFQPDSDAEIAPDSPFLQNIEWRPLPSSLRFIVYEKGLYWIGLKLPRPTVGDLRRGPTTLLLATTSLLKGGLILESASLWIAVGVLLASALFWLPLVRRITVPLRRMRVAAEQMAQGHFDKRLDIVRPDEIGSLATSMNHLAARLNEFVTEKTQFLGDVAHELGSPLARLQYAVAILEAQAPDAMHPVLGDVREEVAQMSALLQEILRYTKAGLQSELHLQPVELFNALEHVLQQENIPPARIYSELREGFVVLADPLYLQRAIANVLRNSLRYADGPAPIRVVARRKKDEILLQISDEGPGVAPEFLHRLCDPFFRTESARTRQTGGVGLGLSIVKRCVEVCGGSVLLRNQVPHGLLVELRFQAA